ncbi:MAG TPA: hypothetical protein ENN29_09155 [Candidatus Hydrogenedentes bacterium]|nr:hypothetical protein [Candidatus Hydrogenedentota bacterium]
MRNLAKTVMIASVLSWSPLALAWEATYVDVVLHEKDEREFDDVLRDETNTNYLVRIYYQPYYGLKTSTDVVVQAWQNLRVKDLRTQIETTNFTSDQRKDKHRYMHQGSSFNETDHVGDASIKYNCFAYAYGDGVYNCVITSLGWETLINEGDLIRKYSIEEAEVASHMAGTPASHVHASFVVRKYIGPISFPSCKGTIETSANKDYIVMYEYRGKQGMTGCVHETGLDAVNNYWQTSKIRYYIKRPGSPKLDRAIP